jgi:hypothetical protein
MDADRELNDLNVDTLNAVIIAELHDRPVPDGAVVAYPYIVTAWNTQIRVLVKEEVTQTLAGLKERLNEFLLLTGVAVAEVSFYQRGILLPDETSMGEVSRNTAIEVRVD